MTSLIQSKTSSPFATASLSLSTLKLCPKDVFSFILSVMMAISCSVFLSFLLKSSFFDKYASLSI